MTGAQVKGRALKIVTKEIQEREDNKPDGSAAVQSKRMPNVIADNKDWVVDQWLQRVNAKR